MEYGRVFIDQISVGARLREIDEKRIPPLMESIKTLGLQYPISVWAEADADSAILVTGLHRLEAAKRLGWSEIDCTFVHLDDVDRSLWEISENLHRAELSVQERSDHIAEWIRLTEVKRISGQVGQKLAKDGSSRGRPESGVSAAARDLGVARKEAERAVKIAAITPEARKVADETGLVSQAARLEIANGKTEAEQVDIARNMAEARKHDPNKLFIDEEKDRSARYIAELLSAQPYDLHAGIASALQLVAKDVAKHFIVLNGVGIDPQRSAA